MFRIPPAAASAARATQRRSLHATAGALELHSSILKTIGRTPVVRINNVAPAHVTMYVKCEFFNPLSSVKDRLAIGIIEDAERSGALKPGMTVVEATSGNTGISLAMVCAQKGYKCVITMAEPFSVERRKLMRALGAKVIVTPAADRGTGMLKKAEELAEKHGWFNPRQFDNTANAAYHSQTTASEILRDFAGESLDYWVTGYGTAGTFLGVARMLKVARPDVKVVVAEPDVASMIQSGSAQPRKGDGSLDGSHSAWTPHPIQGWAPDFLPSLCESALSEKLHSQALSVSGPEAIAAAKLLSSKEGIFTGISGGATFHAALEVAKNAPEGSTLLAMLPDTGERYLSTPLFKDIEADMNDEEQSIAESTPTAILKRPE